MQTYKERYRPLSVRKFPDSLRERIWGVRVACLKKVNIQDIIIEAVVIGLPKIEHRVMRRIPDFVEEPVDG